jgi:8-oxo-dGTP pyrophosphatase MutT (NUDIX family)
VVLLRDGAQGVEVLLLRKNSKITFGGMWVFPGGRIDAEDYSEGGDLQAAAGAAAAREAREEAGIALSADDFVWFSHWTPPPGPQKRFATWFFAAQASDHPIRIDDGEIKEHAWLRPVEALEKHRLGEIDIVPPTWVTLYHLSRYTPVTAILAHFKASEPKVYATRVVKAGDGNRVAMWRGDAGYEDWDADVAGQRHRLVMAQQGFTFENSSEKY